MKIWLKQAAWLLAVLCLLTGCGNREEVRPLGSSASSLPPPESVSQGASASQSASAEPQTPPLLVDGQELKPLAQQTELWTITCEEPALPALSFAAEPQQAQVTVLQQGEELFTGELSQSAAFAPGRSGSYQVEVSAQWEGAQAVYRFAVEFVLTPQFSLDAAQIPVGNTVFLRATNLPEGVTPTAATNFDFTPVFYETDEGMAALLAAKSSLQPGEYTVTVTCGEWTQTLPLTLTDGHFEVEQFTIDETVESNTVNSSQANEEFAQKIYPLYPVGDPVQYWDGPFQMPLVQESFRISSAFGYTRIINDSVSRHYGVDFPAPTGTAVTAPAPGRVLFAGMLQMTGYTILIEHGYGLKSWYQHMDSVAVQPGDMVTTGQKLGEVGSTGFATGPHLHYGMSVNGTFVNPWQYLQPPEGVTLP